MITKLKHKVIRLLRCATLALVLAVGGGSASAGVIHVSIDTSSFSAGSGYLDMQLSASGAVPLATAVVSNMVGFGAIDLHYGVTRAGSGFRFRNDTSNYLSHAVVFGGLLSFDLILAGDADPLTRYVSHFLVSAYDEAFSPMGAFDPVTGALADFSWTPALAPGADGQIGASVADPRVNVVPEPSYCFLIGIGLVALAVGRRRRGA